MDRARGEWLTFVDADDRLEPNHLQLLVDATKNGEPEIVVGGWTLDSPLERRKEIHEAVGEETILSKEQLVHSPRLLVYIWDKLIRKELLVGNGLLFDEGMDYGEDTVLAYQCTLACNRIKAIPMSGYIHVLSGSSAIDRYHAEMEAAFSRILDGKCRLMECAGIPGNDAEDIRRCSKRDPARACVANLFLPGCPFTLREKVRAIRRMVFDDPDVRAAMAIEDRSAHNKFQRIVDFTYDLRSPLAMALVYQLVHPLVTFYRHHIYPYSHS